MSKLTEMNEQYGNSGYNQIDGYGANPYDQRNNDGGRFNNYSEGRYDDPGLEMQNYGGQQGRSANPNAILDECREVDRALNDLDEQLTNLERTFKQVLARPDMPSGEINNLSTQIMTGYRGLVSRVKNIKSKPESGSPRNAPQVGKVDRRLKATINKYQNLEADFRRDSQAAAERQYRIVRPDATEEEVREAVSDPEAPIFQQALLNSDRRGQASSTLRNVKERHEAIQNIERQMVELASLFQELDQVVQQQEPLVTNIEQKGEEIHENVVQANTEISGAIEKARSRNRKKWWCLLIVLLIIIVIVVIAVVVTQVNKATTGGGK
ncbi:Plasma membrane t-SNARE, secretory vesicle fusion [Curvularia kusanoi]|uniref:Plasma membrane t-SNARE, secretory vesicle fusion n=1 Tax=Curvularia kusanoi TaxID=90978 RepID=A0A9P4TGY2_CURKU|nr:Plasma membrane t-SNARE, secretory vesicle fusion [Curvularia kusanoi]